MYDLKDKIVLITGGACGIGAYTVRKLLTENVKHVTFLDVVEDAGLALQDELNTKYESKRVKFIKCDISEADQLLNAFETVKSEQGYIDLVINNAGIFNDKLYAKEIEINLTALVRSSVQAWELMSIDKGGRGGTIINVSSIAAITTASVTPVYSATKTAILKFSTTLGDEVHYPRTGVRVMTICYGVTDTKIVEHIPNFDSVREAQTPIELRKIKWQSAESAAQGLVDVYKTGGCGSSWFVSGDKPAVDITKIYYQSIRLFDQVLFNI